MNEDDKTGSLADQAAAWIPPWQRPVQSSEHEPAPDSAALDVSLGSESVPDEPRPDTDPDDDEPDEQRPETDRWTDVTPDDASHPDPDDEEPEEQRPETDLAEDVDPAENVDPAEDVDLAEDVDPAESVDLPEGVGLAGSDDQPDPDRLIDIEFAEIVQSEAAVAGSDGMGDPDQRTDKEESDRPANLAAALEAILLVVDVPVATDVLAEVLSVSVAEAGAALAALSAEYSEAGRGIDLRRAAGGWRLYTREDYARYVERFVLDGQSVRITQAALETLAVIAYQQPVTRSRMSAIRGVNCDGVVRTLANRGLIEECGTQPESGAFLYRTTPLFLEKLGLDSLDELPPLAPFLPDDVNGFVDA